MSTISSNNLVHNDVVIISSSIFSVRKLNELWALNEKTSCMFETYEELEVILGITKEHLMELEEYELNTLIQKNKEADERNRRTKKNHFYSNSGLFKLSTIHRFKGLEAKTVFYIMHEDDDVEMVCTALTRSTENLVVLDIGGNNKTSSFLELEI